MAMGQLRAGEGRRRVQLSLVKSLVKFVEKGWGNGLNV